METIDLEIENERKHINELEKSLYKIIKGLSKDNEFVAQYIMNIHDKIVEKEASYIFKMQNRNSKYAKEKYRQDINTIKTDNYVKDIKGFVYILKDGDLFKIGKARNIENRISSHRCSNVRFDVFFTSDKIKYYSALEAKLHFIFKNKRISGEWFKLNDKDIATAIDTITEWSTYNKC